MLLPWQCVRDLKCTLGVAGRVGGTELPAGVRTVARGFPGEARDGAVVFRAGGFSPPSGRLATCLGRALTLSLPLAD